MDPAELWDPYVSPVVEDWKLGGTEEVRAAEGRCACVPRDREARVCRGVRDCIEAKTSKEGYLG